MYQRLLHKPLRIWVIEKMMGAAKWLARPTIFKAKIMEHYSIELDVAAAPNGAAASRVVTSATLLVQHHEVCKYRDAATAETEELLKDAEAIFLGADEQGRFR